MTQFLFLVANDLILFTHYCKWLVFAADVTRALTG